MFPNHKMPPTWEEYVSNVLLESGYLSKATIAGHDGRRWATSQGFDVSSAEIQNIIQGYLDPCKLVVDGICLAGQKFTFTRMDSVIMVGRDSRKGWGCVIYRCKLCLVVGVFEDRGHPGGCFNMVSKLGDYLRDQGL